MEKFYKSLVCFSLVTSNLLIAQEMREAPAENSCFDMWMLPDCQHGEREATISAQHREANGIGYNRGYSSLDFFWNLPARAEVHPFIDVRGHIFNDGRFAANAGVGVRRYFCCMDTIFGANIFYDYRNAPHIGFHQIGGGLEAFGCKWDVHLNGYFPIGRKKKLYHDGFYKFHEHRALFQKKYQFSMTGGEVGIGYEVFTSDYVNLHTKIGGYYFHGRFDKQAGGGLFRLKSDITPYFSIEGQVSYDSLFKDIYQGMAALNWPIGKRARKNTTYSCNRRAMQMVDRFEIIVSKKHRKTAPAIDPVTGNPLNFFFVNNTSSSLGTYKSPFPTLVQAQSASNPGDVIYVFPGDGTTSGMNQGITLQSRQQLIGSGIPAQFFTRFGVRTIPAQTTSSPIITGPNVVIGFTDAPVGNVISGFNILIGAVGAIIYDPLTLSPIQNLTIIHNNFGTTAEAAVIELQNPLGNILIAENNFAALPASDAIEIFWDSLPVTSFTNTQIKIFKNQFTACLGAATLDMGNAFNANALVNVDVSYNTFYQGNSNNDGFIAFLIQPSAFEVQSNISITNNTTYGAGYSMILGPTSAGSIFTANVAIKNNTSIGGELILSEGARNFIYYDIENNQFLNSFATSSLTLSGGNAVVNLVNNTSTVANNAAEGFTLANGSTFPMVVLSPNALLSGVAAQNSGSSPLANSDTTIGPITTSGTIDYDFPSFQ